MRKQNKTQHASLEAISNKKDYFPPTLELTIVEMECGLAANSGPVSPLTVGGNAAEVPTDWNGNDDTTITTPF